MIGQDLGFRLPRTFYVEDSRLVLPRAFLGLEFEYENVERYPDEGLDWVDMFDIVEDHSLRGAAREFVFERPMFGKDVIDAVLGLTNFAREAGYTTGLRTGLHVHVDVRDMEYPQLQTMIVVSALCEAALYNFAGDNREENVFCLPWYSAEKAIEAARDVFNAKGDSLKRAAQRINAYKYSGLNLDPLSRFGSIEYRHLRCTTDFDRILSWVNVLLRFKEFSQRWDKGIEDILRGLKSREFWQEALGPQLPTLEYPNFLLDVQRKCLPVVHQLLSSPAAHPPKGKKNPAVVSLLGKRKNKTGPTQIPMPRREEGGGINVEGNNLIATITARTATPAGRALRAPPMNWFFDDPAATVDQQPEIPPAPAPEPPTNENRSTAVEQELGATVLLFRGLMTHIRTRQVVSGIARPVGVEVPPLDFSRVRNQDYSRIKASLMVTARRVEEQWSLIRDRAVRHETILDFALNLYGPGARDRFSEYLPTQPQTEQDEI